MHNETYELLRVQENCADLLDIVAKKVNKRPQKHTMTLRDIYMNQFVNINEQQLRGIYNGVERHKRIRR